MGKKTNLLVGAGLLGLIGVAARHLIKNDETYEKVKGTADNIYGRSKDFADHIRDKFKENSEKSNNVAETVESVETPDTTNTEQENNNMTDEDHQS